jgi:hypothetical protein
MPAARGEHFALRGAENRVPACRRHGIMSNMDVQDRLLRAMGKREPVRVSRNIRKTGDVGGYVLAVGTEWVLVALLQDVALNGFVALRLNDVTGVKRGYAPKF